MTKSKRQVKIVDVASGEETVRDATDLEIDQMELDKQAGLAYRAEMEAKATERQAILDRIGLTADELKTILG